MADEGSETAQDRTQFAEDRTLLANERTFSGWARTSMAAIGLGLGFHVLFQKIIARIVVDARREGAHAGRGVSDSSSVFR
jgi:uncharacterized membrane protein YidH (DUF202 family)